MEETLLPDYTLRCHKSAVTCMGIILNSSQFDFPALYSADENGTLLIWDLVIRRPVFEFVVNSSCQIVWVQYIPKHCLFAILSKNHTLKVYQLTKRQSKELVGQSGVEHNGTFENYDFKLVFQIPVNTLNFANFLIRCLLDELYQLVCCNTQDAENIDVYTFRLHDDNSLKRVRKNLNFYRTVKKFLTNHTVSKIDKLGILMKLVESGNVIYCGFESGYVIGFEIMQYQEGNTNNIEQDKDAVIKIVYISDAHFPNPVLDMIVSELHDNSVVSSSVDNKLYIHNIKNISDLNQTLPSINIENHFSDDLFISKQCRIKADYIEIPTTEINAVTTLNSLIIVSNWKGIVYVVNENQDILKRYRKTKSKAIAVISPVGNLNNTDSNSILEQKNQSCKVKTICVIQALDANAITKFNFRSISQQKRLLKFLSVNWCLVGYEDGCIALNVI